MVAVMMERVAKVPPGIDAEWAAAEVGDNQSAAEERKVLHEIDLLHHGGLRIGESPEAVHNKSHQHEE